MNLMWSKNWFLCSVFWIAKVLSTYIFHSIWGLGDVLMALISKLTIKRFATVGPMGGSWLLPEPVHKTYPGTRSRCTSDRTPAGQ